jgi:hypothetical protein
LSVSRLSAFTVYGQTEEELWAKREYVIKHIKGLLISGKYTLFLHASSSAFLSF